MKFMKLGSKPDSFQTDGQVRFVATELATDIIVNVGDLHKFPLLSKSSRLQKLVTTTDGDEAHDEIHISDIPGGAAAFQICAKFCYGMTFTLNAYNVIKARCAAEYLGTGEAAERGNLVHKTEVFLASSIFRSWKDSVVVLRTTRSLLPWSEDLKLVGHCTDAVAAGASVEAPKVDWSYAYDRRKLPDGSGVRKQQSAPEDRWVEDLCELELDWFKRVVAAIGTKGRVLGRAIGEALRAYTYRRLPGFGEGSFVEGGDVTRSRTLLETVVGLLPEGKGSVSCSFMLRLLRTGNILDCNVTCRRDLARRVGGQLEEATVQDLLMPAPAGGTTLLHDIDVVSAIVEEFVALESRGDDAGGNEEAVARLVDGYLAEVAADANLPVSKFLDLAEMVPGESRPVHDGIYRAVDMYLKEHPNLTKSERKKLCGLMDCRKLSADARSHAVQNERLPLRVVVQALFFEKARATAASGSTGADASSGVSYGSSRSVATATATGDHPLESMKLVEGANGKGSDAKVRRSSVVPKKIFGKLLSNSSSCTSAGSAGSTNQDEPKPTPSRNTRLSVSSLS